MFISNKYTNCYNNIITKAKARISGEYTELHHIMPKCLGGSNDKNNLVRLSAREHFVCHLLLTKMTTGKAQFQMIKAAHMMTVSTKKQYRYKISSRIYEQLKKAASCAMSALTKGKPKHTEKSKKILSDLAKGKPSLFKGKSHSTHSKQLQSLAKSKPCISPKGEIFSSTKEAGLVYGISGPGIRGLIKTGRSGWKYYKTEDQQKIEACRKPKVKMYRPHTTEHVQKRNASRKMSGHYKNKEETLKRMSNSAKKRYQ